MLLWIILSLIAVAVVVTFLIVLIGKREHVSDALAASLLALVCGAVVGCMVMAVGFIVFKSTTQFRTETEHSLAALQSSNSTSGTFFLGSGHINGQRVLNYITETDGAFRIESADAGNSVIYEDAERPTVTVHEWDVVRPESIPWTLGTRYSYTFHIPKGSILSDYTVTNE